MNLELKFQAEQRFEANLTSTKMWVMIRALAMGFALLPFMRQRIADTSQLYSATPA